MKQELVAPFTLKALLIAEQALIKSPELEITFLAMNSYNYNDALAMYDYSRTVEDLNRISVVCCNEQVDALHLVALAAFEPENRLCMEHVGFKQQRLTRAAYGNQQDIISGREYFSQVKTAATGIINAHYTVDSEFLSVDKPSVNAIESGYFKAYMPSQAVSDLVVEESDESSIVATEERGI